jgi:hypothetical protein
MRAFLFSRIAGARAGHKADRFVIVVTISALKIGQRRPSQ